MYKFRLRLTQVLQIPLLPKQVRRLCQPIVELRSWSRRPRSNSPYPLIRYLELIAKQHQ